MVPRNDEIYKSKFICNGFVSSTWVVFIPVENEFNLLSVRSILSCFELTEYWSSHAPLSIPLLFLIHSFRSGLTSFGFDPVRGRIKYHGDRTVEYHVSHGTIEIERAGNKIFLRLQRTSKIFLF